MFVVEKATDIDWLTFVAEIHSVEYSPRNISAHSLLFVVFCCGFGSENFTYVI